MEMMRGSQSGTERAISSAQGGGGGSGSNGMAAINVDASSTPTGSVVSINDHDKHFDKDTDHQVSLISPYDSASHHLLVFPPFLYLYHPPFLVLVPLKSAGGVRVSFLLRWVIFLACQDWLRAA
ncbi:hypothetical protein CRG98_037130 [Punica granatum]|uniref:Uncharacterized protein n=1 Tax=Punica granatum TaxID=22663 RepID=A0A2I0IEN4_PUNGR|nr:hypothetical protein CRG98_037130 [Punica granatum]